MAGPIVEQVRGKNLSGPAAFPEAEAICIMKHTHSLPAGRKYVPITNDKVFKLVFSEPANKDILIHLLNILIPGKDIVDLTYLDKEHHGFVFKDKSTNFDVYCKAKSGERFVVEMQGEGQKSFADRILYYSTYPIREQLIERGTVARLRRLLDRIGQRRKNMDYALTPVYMVSITDFGMPHPSGDGEVLEDGLVSRYSIRDDHKGELMTDALHFVFFEIGRLPYRPGEEDRCTTGLQKIAFAMKYMAEYREVPAALRDEILVERIFEASTIANMTPKQRKYYDRNVMETIIDRQAKLDYAREEAKKEIARKMLGKGYSPAEVQELTGLSAEEIAALKETAGK